jgi:hypothetical protein
MSRLYFKKKKGAYLGGFVLGGCDEICAVGRELNVVDLHIGLVGLDVFQLLTSLPTVRKRFSDKRLRHTLASYWLTVPSSCPAMINLLR